MATVSTLKVKQFYNRDCDKAMKVTYTLQFDAEYKVYRIKVREQGSSSPYWLRKYPTKKADALKLMRSRAAKKFLY